MPEWSMEHLGAYEFMDIMKYTLKTHLSRKSIEDGVHWNGNVENQKDELNEISSQARRALDLIHVEDDKVSTKRGLLTRETYVLVQDYTQYFSDAKFVS